MRVWFVSFFLGLMVCFIFSGTPTQAQDSNLSAGTLTALQTTPEIVLETYPSGGAEMVGFVARALVSDAGLVDNLIELIGKANDAQKAAIGAGLGRVAKLCEAIPEDGPVKSACVDRAEAIAKAVAKSNDGVVMASFALGTGDAPAAIATGGQAPAGGAPGGNVGASAAGTNLGNGSGSRVTTSSTDYFNSAGGNSYTGSSGSTSITVVSPTT